MKRFSESERTTMILECANYCVQHNWSTRVIARNMGVSQTTVCKWLHVNLKYIDSQLYNQCKRALNDRRSESL